MEVGTEQNNFRSGTWLGNTLVYNVRDKVEWHRKINIIVDTYFTYQRY